MSCLKSLILATGGKSGKGNLGLSKGLSSFPVALVIAALTTLVPKLSKSSISVRISLSENLLVMPSVPELKYFTKSVGGSSPSVKDTLTTLALTPVVPPIIFKLSKSSITLSASILL